MQDMVQNCVEMTGLSEKKTLESMMSQVTDENLHPEIQTGGPVGQEELVITNC